MELFTDKAKEKFHFYCIKDRNYNMRLNMTSKEVKELSIELLWGVIEDFAESLGYIIEVYPISVSAANKIGIRFDYVIHTGTGDNFIESKGLIGVGSKNDTRLEVIKILNKLINEDDKNH